MENNVNIEFRHENSWVPTDYSVRKWGTVLVGMGHALTKLGHEQMRSEEEEAVRFGKGGQGRSFPFYQVAAGPDETGDSPADKRLHYPSPYRILSLAHII